MYSKLLPDTNENSINSIITIMNRISNEGFDAQTIYADMFNIKDNSFVSILVLQNSNEKVVFNKEYSISNFVFKSFAIDLFRNKKTEIFSIFLDSTLHQYSLYEVEELDDFRYKITTPDSEFQFELYNPLDLTSYVKDIRGKCPYKYRPHIKKIIQKHILKNTVMPSDKPNRVKNAKRIHYNDGCNYYEVSPMVSGGFLLFCSNITREGREDFSTKLSARYETTADAENFALKWIQYTDIEKQKLHQKWKSRGRMWIANLT